MFFVNYLNLQRTVHDGLRNKRRYSNNPYEITVLTKEKKIHRIRVYVITVKYKSYARTDQQVVISR